MFDRGVFEEILKDAEFAVEHGGRWRTAVETGVVDEDLTLDASRAFLPYFYCLAGLNRPNRCWIIDFHDGVIRVRGRSWNGDTNFDSNRCWLRRRSHPR